MESTAVTSRTLSERERETILDLLRTVVQKKIAPRADQHDREGPFPMDNFQGLHRAGLLGLAIPTEYGGLGGGMGGDPLVFYLSVYEIAKACGSTALSWGHHGYIAGLVNPLGTPEQQQRYFGRVIRDGALFASIGTEPRVRHQRPEILLHQLPGCCTFLTVGSHEGR